MELRSEVEILAEPAEVWRVLTDFAGYGSWNPFILSISGKLAVGEKLNLTLSEPDGGERRLKPIITVLEAERELAFRARWVFAGLLEGKHFMRLRESDQGTRLLQGGDFSGALVGSMGKTLTHSARGMVFMNQALKKLIESKA